MPIHANTRSRVGRWLRMAVACAAALACAAAQSQVRLPDVATPTLPTLQLPIEPGDAIDAARGALSPDRLRDLRQLRIRALLRANPNELEADPSGAPVVRGELVAYDLSESARRAALDAGFTVVRESTLSGLDIAVTILAPPPRTSLRQALRRLQRADPSGRYDYNHIYIESGAVDVPQSDAPARGASVSTPAQSPIGLIDTGVDRAHPSLRAARVEQWGCERPTPAAHGTAVASLLVGQAPNFTGAAPSASLYAADVYCGLATGGSIEKIAAAFAWLSEQRVPVINVSLVGPRNVLLEHLVAKMVARGHVIVAAVGNDGPAARPLYPAAYPGVIGVTGVDAKRRVLVEAGRGKHVFIAAPGADMGAAGLEGEYVAVRGTSFAAPIVSGLLASQLQEVDASKARRAVEHLAGQALDLGSRGVDKVYGHGLVGEAVRIEPRALAAAMRAN